MVDTRPTSSAVTTGGRPEVTGGRALAGRTPGRAELAHPQSRQRIPTLRQLAALVVEGMLMLPRNYRRGMFLDITV